MKGRVLVFILGFLLIGANLYAADGDLIVNNKLGVGTTSPAYKLDVSGDVRFTGILQGGSVPWARLTTYPTACTSGQYVSGIGATLTCSTPAGSGGLSGSGTAYYISKWTAGTTLGNSLIYDNATNVGIGTTSPAYKLDVSGDMRFTGTLQGGSVPWARLSTYPSACTTGQYVSGIGSSLTCSTPPSSSGISGSGTASYIPKWTGGTSIGNSLIYDNGTSIGIGTTSPSLSYKLNIDGGLSANSNGGTQLLLNSTASSGQSVQIAFGKAGSWKWMMGVDSGSDSWTVYDVALSKHAMYVAPASNFYIYPNGGGNVGIGSWNASYKLYVSGSAYATSGWYSSDKKFKEDIAPIESALSKVLQINGVSFTWNTKAYAEKEFPDGKHYGVIAQDIEKVLPEVVKTVRFKLKDKEVEEEEKAVAYSELIPILIEAIKEQEKKIENLEAVVADLTARK